MSARFQEGMVVVTHETVPCTNARGKREGGALPGWRWKVVKVVVEPNKMPRYEVTAESAPGYYNATLRESQISDSVGPKDGQATNPPGERTGTGGGRTDRPY